MTSQAGPSREPESAEVGRDAERWLEDHGDVLFRFARSRVARREAAEDLVQETLLAGLSARAEFRGESAVRTWLLSILRRKIADHYRGEYVRVATDDAQGTKEPRTAVERLVFTDDGWFRRTPARWTSPLGALEDGELRAALELCLAGLPPTFRVAFTLRERDGLSPDEVRARLGVSAGNLRVRLYRARLMLRECLERRQFAPEPSPPPPAGKPPR